MSTFEEKIIKSKTDSLEPEKQAEAEKEDSQYLKYFQDYANRVWSTAAHYSYDCESDISKFKKYIKSRPLPSIEDCYDEKEDILKHGGEKTKKLNDVIARINLTDDETTFKKLINAALYLIYPDRGKNQEYKEDEFSADEI